MLRIATLNANGIRASLRKGLEDWLRRRQPDILCLQEIRAQPADLGAWAAGPHGWHACWNPAQRPGYAGVAILSRTKPDRVETKFGDPRFDDEGRWLRADFGKLAVVSLYLPSGSHAAVRQEVKYQCMGLLHERLRKLRRMRKEVVVAGDYNIAHTKQDIKNWQGNQKNSGFLPEEREWFGTVLDKLGWVDVFRQLHPQEQRYTWWSQRGGARERDVGWRIDYQLATPGLAKKALQATIDREPILSDHAPLCVVYNFPHRASPFLPLRK